MPNRFYANNQFYFKEFRLAWVHSVIAKDNSILSYSVHSNSSNSTNLVYNKSIYCLHTVKCQNITFLNNSG